VTELIANVLLGFLGATGVGIDSKLSGGFTGATGDGIDTKWSGVVTGVYKGQN
jgi:hypothetical protein